MAQDHQLQQQRFELKYLITEKLAAPIRDFVKGYLELDEYSLCHPDLSYPIHSLYLDSEELDTHHATINGTKNRFKLRLRYYDNRPETPVFFEVKARVDNCILKQRCGVRRAAVPFLLAGQFPEREWLLSPEPRHRAALERFLALTAQLQARPRLHNSYAREAWVSPEANSVRVTFDRNIQAEPWFHFRTTCDQQRPVRVKPGVVILELKFTTRFPDWFRLLVERFNLMQGSCAKYSEGVLLIGEHRLRPQTFSEWKRGATTQSAPTQETLSAGFSLQR
jgi:hypothetical protein